MFNLYLWENREYPFLLVSHDKCKKNGIKTLGYFTESYWSHKGVDVINEPHRLGLIHLLPAQFIGTHDET